MVIDEEEKEDEEEDLNDVPLFDNSEDIVDPFHLDESSHISPPQTPPDADIAPCIQYSCIMYIHVLQQICHVSTCIKQKFSCICFKFSRKVKNDKSHN